MANIPPIQFKRSHNKGSKPTANQLAVGELAINFVDGYIFSKDSDGNVIRMGGGGLGILAVDSEKVLTQDISKVDSDSIKHKEVVIFDISQRRLLTWDSDIDAYKQIGGSGGGGASTEVIYQDFFVTQNNQPVFTITNTDLNNTLIAEEFYVLYGGYPLPSHAFTVLGQKGAWRIRLDSSKDFAGDTYDVGDWIRIGRGNSLKVYETSIGTTTIHHYNKSGPIHLVEPTAIVTTAYDSDVGVKWSNNTANVTGVIFDSDLVRGRTDIFWFDGGPQPFMTTTVRSLTDGGFKYLVSEKTNAYIQNPTNDGVIQKVPVWNYYKVAENATDLFVDSEVEIDSVAYTKLHDTMDFFNRFKDDFTSNFSNIGGYVTDFNNGSGFRYLDNEWQHDTITYKAESIDSDLVYLNGLEGVYVRHQASSGSGRLQVAAMNNKEHVVLFRSLTANSTTNWATTVNSGRGYIGETAESIDITAIYKTSNDAYNVFSEIRIGETMEDMARGKYKYYQVWANLQPNTVTAKSVIWVRRLK